MGRERQRDEGLADPVISFDRFVADFDRQLLRADGETVHLAPQTWRLFEYLVAHEGVVEKDELLTALWPDESASEYAMSRTVRRLREALGDDARAPQFLRTVHGVGFQWIARTTPSSESAPPPSRTTADSRFIGRVSHIETLAGAAASAARGRRQFVAIEGDLGVGKTTLVEEFLGAQGGGWWVARGRSIEWRSTPEPYAPLLDAIDRLAALAPHAVVPAIRKYAPTWLAQMPWLATDDDRLVIEGAVRTSSRGRMLRELARLLEELTMASPVLLFIDDLHWADTATIDAIDTLVSRDERARLLVIVSLRPTDGAAPGQPLSTLLSELALRNGVRRMYVDPFDSRDLRDLVDTLLPSTSTRDASALSDELARWTGGNALFATAALAHLQTQDLDTAAVSVEHLPSTLSDLVDEVIATLSAEDGELLEVAALIADEVPAALVADVMELDPVEAESRLTHIAQTTPILLQSAGAADVPHRFAHAAFRHRFISRVGRLRAERLHRSIGDTLERQVDGTVEPREIARHLDLGGQRQRAVPHWLVAGQRSRRRFAHRDALAQYEKAVSALSALEPSGQSVEHVIEARLGLAISQLALGTNVDIETQENIDELQRLVEPLGSIAAAFPIWQSTLLVNNLAGRTDRVRSMAPTLLALATERGRQHELMDAHHSVGEAALHAGDLDEARRHFDEADRLLESSPSVDLSDGVLLWRRDSGARVKSARAGVAILQDRLDDARDEVAASLERSTDGPNTPLVRVGNLTICSAILWLLGDTERAVELADTAIEVAAGENEDFTAIASVVRWASGSSHHRSDVRAAVRTMLDQPTVPFPLGLIVFFRSDLLPPFEALDLLDETVAQCSRVDTHWTDAEWARQRGRLLLLDGAEYEEAEPHLRRAIELATQHPSPFVLRAAERDLAACQSGSGTL